MWEKEFKAQDYGRLIHKHRELPIYVTDEFNFYRCVEFNDAFYGKTVSELHAGNLRYSQGRYAALFPGQKLSYWANNVETAKAEIRRHGAQNDILTFWAYDDATSTFPTIEPQEPLIIVDGRKCGIQPLIDKIDEGKSASQKEMELLQAILGYHPDCLVYDSHAIQGGENYIFFEKGFKKLALRQVRLYLGSKKGRKNAIYCADGTDYTPFVEEYGKYFAPIAKVKMDTSYLQTDEYKQRETVLEESHRRIWEFYNRSKKKK